MRVGEAWAVFVAILLGPIGAAQAEVTPTAPAKPAAAEPEGPPRPPLPPEPPSAPLPWERHIDVGADLLFLARPTSSPVHLGAALGYGAHLNWELVRHLRFTFYIEGARHPVTLAPGALGQPGLITSASVSTYMFGTRFSPALDITPRLRAWLTAGFGWGRFSYPRMTSRDPGQAAFSIPARSAYVVEIPMGVGLSFELIPRWLSLQAELTGAPIVAQEGTAVAPSQAIDAAGKKRAIGSLPQIDASIVQSIGLSLLL
jgi:hypothetical protein